MDKLKPEKTLPLARGKAVDYHGIRISRTRGNKLSVNGTTAECVEFSRNGGVGSVRHCIAVLVNDEALIFEGPQTGPGMLRREQVLKAGGL
jgi:hypothetical protein